jgi:hypothetical protein
LHAAQFAPDTTTAAAQAAHNRYFDGGVPGVQFSLVNLTPGTAARLKAGALYELTLRELPPCEPAAAVSR